jgi:hypothetical protein
MSEGLFIYALFIIIGFGALSIAMLAVTAARRRNQGQPASATQLPIEEAMELHRIRTFLRSHPEWEGRDYIWDPAGPSHQDPGTSPVRR